MENQENKYTLIKYEDGELNLDVNVSIIDGTVWLTKDELALLFERDRSVIGKHIKTIIRNLELNDSSVRANFAHTASDGKTYFMDHYNLDMVLAIARRVKSGRIERFKQWALNISDEYKNKNGSIKPLIKFEYNEMSLDVTVSPDEDTVWLNKDQIATLFETTRQNVEYHINNIYTQNELEINATCKEILQVQTEGKREVVRTINIYNLDMIISLGYRINSKNGIIFRKWATKVLKEYLLKGSAINNERCLACESNILNLHNKYNEVQSELKSIKSDIKNIEETLYSSKSKIIYESQIIDGYIFLRKLFFLAKKEITISDYYADKFLLSMLSDIKVNITIITSTSSYLNKETLPNNIKIIHDNNIHGRYIFIDDVGYVIDNSFNNIGKKELIIIKLEDITKEMIFKK